MTRPPRKPSQPLLADADAPLRSRPRRRRDHPAQPQLLLDPMPARVDPCLALLKPRPPKGRQWAFEVKWDGYRLAVHIEPKGVRILTRGGHDWTDRFPAIVAQAKRLPVSTAILDSEAVVFDELGRSDFGRLQQSLGGRGGKRTSWESVCMVFDLLYLDGHDLTETEFTARRHLLERIVPAGGEKAIRLSEEIEADGETLLRIACEHGLEGIIAKDRNSTYRGGRGGGEWQKIKCVQSDGFAIVGYQRSSSAFGNIGALLLAARKGGQLVARLAELAGQIPEGNVVVESDRAGVAHQQCGTRTLICRSGREMSAIRFAASSSRAAESMQVFALLQSLR